MSQTRYSGLLKSYYEFVWQHACPKPWWFCRLLIKWYLDRTRSETIFSRKWKKIREIKQRPDTPFSVMAPSLTWIKENCVISKEAEKYLKQLPGPITLILKTKDSPVAPEVAPGKDSVGIRIPNHWFHKIVKELKIPISGIIENMTMAKTHFIRSEICQMGLQYLGSISFDQNLEDSIGKPDKLLKTGFMKNLDKIVEKIS